MSSWLKKPSVSNPLVILTALVFLLAAGWLGWQSVLVVDRRTPGTSIDTIFDSVRDVPTQSSIGPEPTPHPATIPGLRATPVDSTDLEIVSTYANNGSYTSYRAAFTAQGLREYGLLTVPNTPPPEGGYPAIVFVHGYIAPTLYKTNERYVEYVNYLASRGFVVFKVDLRGHDQSEGQAGGGYFSPGYVMDVRHAVAALQGDERVDSAKIGVWGHSMAGNVAMRAAVVDANIAAVVIWGGAVYSYEDMRELGLNDTSYRPPPMSPDPVATPGASRREITEKYGEADLNTPFWQTMAPITYLSELSAPVQLHHAVNDTVVSVDYARGLKQYGDTAGASIELFEYPSGGHDIEGASFGTAMQRTVEFYQKNL